VVAEAIKAPREPGTVNAMTIRAAIELAAYTDAKAPFIRSVIERAMAQPALTADPR
jgi:hypothetical protein